MASPYQPASTTRVAAWGVAQVPEGGSQSFGPTQVVERIHIPAVTTTPIVGVVVIAFAGGPDVPIYQQASPIVLDVLGRYDYDTGSFAIDASNTNGLVTVEFVTLAS